MTCSILVPEAVANTVAKRLQRLATKAGVTVERVPGQTRVYRKVRVTKVRRDDSGRVHQYDVLQVDPNQVVECDRLTVGELPRFNGHSFLGKLVHTSAGNILAMAPHAQGIELPPEWRSAKPTCDHCKTKRSRTETFIIQCPDGSIQRVGRNCLADFLMGDPGGMVALAEFEDALRSYEQQDLDSDGCYGGAVRWTPTPFHYLACAFSSVESVGFVKRSEGCGVPTSEDTMFLADAYNASRGGAEKQADWKARQPTEAHSVEAIGALLWLADEDGSRNDYIHNLQVGLLQHAVDKTNMGLIASVPTAYARHLGKLAEKNQAAGLPASSHLGTVGERLDLHVTVLSRFNYVSNGPWGDSSKTCVKVRTAEGHELVTFTGGDCPTVEHIGKVVRVRGTVKRHSEYQGRPQTALSRCTWYLEEQK